MTSDGKYTAEMLEDARSPLVAGMTREAAVTHLRIKWGLERDAAERLLEAARKPDASGPSHSVSRRIRNRNYITLGASLIVVAVVGLVFLDNFISLDQLVFRSMRVVLAAGIGMLVAGVWQKYEVSELIRLAAPMYLLVAGIVIALALLLGVMLTVSISNTTKFDPDMVDSDMAETELVWVDQGMTHEGGDRYTLSGYVKNPYYYLSVDNVQMKIIVRYGEAKVISEHEVAMFDSPIPPLELRPYDVDLVIPEIFTNYEMKLTFDLVD